MNSLILFCICAHSLLISQSATHRHLYLKPRFWPCDFHCWLPGGSGSCWRVWKQRTAWCLPEISRLEQSGSLEQHCDIFGISLPFRQFVALRNIKGKEKLKFSTEIYTLFIYSQNNHNKHKIHKLRGVYRFCNRPLRSSFGRKGKLKRKENSSIFNLILKHKQNCEEYKQHCSVESEAPFHTRSQRRHWVTRQFMTKRQGGFPLPGLH